VDSSAVARRVARKELELYFASPAAWLFLAGFAAVCLFIFFWAESFFARNIADTRPLFEWMPVLLIFLCSALTMRLWSEERRSGTLEHVLVQPSALWRFVLGKFRACLLLLVLALATTLPLPITIHLMAELDWGPVLAGYAATLLLGSAYLAIGLYVSARTDSPVVSLIGSTMLCGLLYMVGSPVFTEFFPGDTADIMRQFGTGARFDSITRGVIDARDLLYYLSLTVGFLVLNVYALEREGWARFASSPRQRYWRTGTALVLANLLLANIWIARAPMLRADVTEGNLHSISQPSRAMVSQLREPLLIRGYFSARTHPLLAPLEPQLKDLIREYEVAGGGQVKVEFVDPALHPELEREANERYGILAAPFQVADRYQSALVSAYFNVLVQYGTEYETLSFADLIEVRTAASGKTEVLLRNPEYDITRAIRDVMYNYRAGGDLFAGIEKPVEFIGYVSDDERLPPLLRAYRQSIAAQLETAQAASDGKFSFRFLKPEAGAGELARQIGNEWGFAPMTSALDEEQEFYFYLTLADQHQVVQLPTEEFDPTRFRQSLDSGLKRFARGFTKTVALSVPPVNEQLAQYGLGGPRFANLERAITRDYSIIMEDLSDGSVDPEADILAVVAPHQLDQHAVFAIDQFLMRGGTVVLATSPYSVQREQGSLRRVEWSSGLEPWLAHNGIDIGNALVLDERNAMFPAPVKRESGDYEFRDVKMLSYPYFIDVRRSGIAAHALTGSLPQITLAWASPLAVERRGNRRVSELLWSSPRSWLSKSPDITPIIDAEGRSIPFRPAEGVTRQPHNLGAILQGRFDSLFDSPPSRRQGVDQHNSVTGLIKRSPESSRILVFSSNDLLSDQVLASLVKATGTQYLGPLELFSNTLDWALQEEQLLDIRSRAHFNRTLPPMEQQARVVLELFNYGAAILWLVLLALWRWLLGRSRRRRYARELGL
jgi:gliding motility-associated transport system permease protein/gliding motility-associatede transport system auxiliary component